MPGVYVDNCSNLKEILNLLTPLPNCNWYITDLDCLDHCGWPGSEKWGETTLFLTHDELMKDINFRDPQIIFGVFSAIPVDVPKSEIFSAETPYADGNSCYMKSTLFPQHPKAFLEITPFDAGAVYIISHDNDILKPLYGLSYDVHDEEMANAKMNQALRRIRTAIESTSPTLKLWELGEIQWRCWHKLFKDDSIPVDDNEIIAVASEILNSEKLVCNYYNHRHMWNPFTEIDEIAEEN